MNPEIADGAQVAQGARLAEGVRVEPGAVIHADVVLGADCLVEAGAVLGKIPRLRRGSSAASDRELEPLILEDRVTVCCGAVVYAGARVGEGAILGDQCQVRERTIIGAASVVGRGSCVDFDARVGCGVLIQTGVYVTARSVVEDDVFLGPGVQMANDDTMGRHPPGVRLIGPVLRRGCRIGAGAVLLPGVEIGSEAFVAAGAVVTKDVGPREVVMGVPARVVRRVGDEDLLERWR